MNRQHYYIYFKEVKEGIDPLNPENKLIFMTSPLTGTLSEQGRYVVERPDSERVKSFIVLKRKYESQGHSRIYKSIYCIVG
ncbi:MAG: aldehyde ferredoxin oxidoreductase N-terminal domain-containing protein [Candidatus Bathyarchaeia archaeon]